MTSRRSAAAVVGALLCLAAAALPGPAVAHESDPQIRTELTSVRPALPAEVVLQVQANIAPQLVVDNPTDVALDVLDSDGQPFLRISRDGVFANLESLDFYTTNNFSGSDAAAPRVVLERTSPAPPRWARLSDGTSWGWFDHRLDPEGAQPRDRSREAVLGTWTVPFRYGGRPVVVSGLARFAPVRGAFEVTADPAPEGLTVQVLQGRLPGLFVANTGSEAVTVLDDAGQPYVRLSPQGSELNVNSRLHLEDQRARGVATPEVSPGVRVEPFSGTSRTWLDTRLRYEAGSPPERALRIREPTVLDTWRIPVLLGTRPAALTGQVRWVPSSAAALTVQSSPPPPDRRSTLPALVVSGGVIALLGAALLARRASRRRVARPA